MKYKAKSVLQSTYKHKDKSVSGAFAPIGTLCDEKKNCESEIFEILRIIETIKTQYVIEYYCIMFLMETGCRISEALKITANDIDNLGRVRINATKKSRNRIVVSPTCTKFLLQQKKVGGDVFARFNRFHIYRIIKKYGLGAYFGENKRQSITHYFRHINASIGAEIARDINEVAQLLGHKDTKSTQFYLKRESKEQKNTETSKLKQ